jgi:hypothetical protein
MKMTLTSFGQISVEGVRYDHDIVIENGHVRKRQKRTFLLCICHYSQEIQP